MTCLCRCVPSIQPVLDAEAGNFREVLEIAGEQCGVVSERDAGDFHIRGAHPQALFAQGFTSGESVLIPLQNVPLAEHFSKHGLRSARFAPLGAKFHGFVVKRVVLGPARQFQPATAVFANRCQVRCGGAFCFGRRRLFERISQSLIQVARRVRSC